MKNSIFVVDDEPYCLWDPDLRERNREFIDRLDPTYFEYCLRVHAAQDDTKHAPLALKVALHHALETLFSLLGAYVQAPRHAYAWIAKCSTTQLRSFTQRVSEGDSNLVVQWRLPNISWHSVAAAVMKDYLPGSERNKITVQLFGELWARLVCQLNDPEQHDEYNAIKHGFRVSSGGFGLSAGIEGQYGVSPPADQMQLIGHSDYGAAFLKVDRVGVDKNNRSLKVRHVAMNWSYEQIALLLQLAYLSINNVVSALKSANDFEASQCMYLRPESDEDFVRPWAYVLGVNSLKLEYVIDDAGVRPTSRDELLAALKAIPK